MVDGGIDYLVVVYLCYSCICLGVLVKRIDNSDNN